MKASRSLGIKLSPRQTTLLKRLKVVCERAETLILPVFIEEIWGFGSLFRAKERPGDLDLLVKFSGHNPKHDLFRNLMDKAMHRHNEFSTPQEALLQIIKQEISEDSAKELIPIFNGWLEGYTWNKVFDGFVPGISYSWERLTIRLLKQDVPRVSIHLTGIEDKPHLNAESLVLVWSKKNPNLHDNIKQVLSPSKITDVIWKELENFDRQINTCNVESNVVQKVFKKLLDADPQITDYDEMRKWMTSEASASFPMLTKENLSKIILNVHMMFPEDSGIVFTFDQTKYRAKALEELKEIVEQRRLEVKESKWQLEVFRMALRQLGRLKRERLHENDWYSKWTPKQWIAMMTLQDIPKQLVSEEKIRENLRKLDLPENRVFADKRFGKTEYTIPENVEEEVEIKNRNMLVEARRKYVRQLQPEVKRINKALSLEVEVDDKLLPKLARVWYHYSTWEEKELPLNVKSVLEWCEEHKFKIDKRSHGFFAELAIPVLDCSEIRQMKDKIRKALK